MKENNSKMMKNNELKNNVFSNWLIHYKGMSGEDIRKGFLNNLEYNIAKDKYSLTLYDHNVGVGLGIEVLETNGKKNCCALSRL